MIVTENNKGTLTIELENIDEMKTMWMQLNMGDTIVNERCTEYNYEVDGNVSFDMFDIYDDSLCDIGVSERRDDEEPELVFLR